jgi:pyroglutamyl-peptidase
VYSILLTGFGPFPGVARNPTADVVARLDKTQLSYEGRQWSVHGVVLDVAWESGPNAEGRPIRGAPDALRDAVARFRPELLVSMGVATSERSRFRIEASPTDTRTDAVADVAGRKASGRAHPSAPFELTTNLPAGWIIDKLDRRGIRMDESRDAGKYLCESITYEGALLVREKRSTLVMSGFVHVPNVYASDDAVKAGVLTAEQRATLPMLDTIVDVMKTVLEISLCMIPRGRPPTTKGTAADQLKGAR